MFCSREKNGNKKIKKKLAKLCWRFILIHVTNKENSCANEIEIKAMDAMKEKESEEKKATEMETTTETRK